MSYLGEEIPKLGFGLMRLPHKEDGSSDVEQVKDMVDAFLAAGGTYFDTARVYGDSEETIKAALVDRYPRESYYLATKNAAWIGAKSAEEARAYFQESLEKTGAGYFDFYLLHNLGDSRTKVFEDWNMWEWARGLKEKGLIKHLGFSMHDTADTLETILKAHPEAEFVQLQINYADWENSSIQARKCFEMARKYDKPVIIMEPVRGGTLANPPQSVADILREADPHASPVSWALRFDLQLPGIITVLSGASTLSQMEENIDTFKNFKPLSDVEMETIGRAQEALSAIHTVPCTNCKYCMKDCPQEIDIANLMQALIRYDLYGMDDGAKWYGFAGTKGSECIQCGSCEAACPQHIDIMAQLERSEELFAGTNQTIKVLEQEDAKGE